MKRVVKYIPNGLTVFRILLAMLLIWNRFGSSLFFMIYIMAGVTDCLDGLFARKLHVESEVGARLDSLADSILCLVVLIQIIPHILRRDFIVVSIILIAGIRITAILVCLFRYHVIVMLHTYANKLTGVLLFMVPLLLERKGFWVFSIVLIAAASYSSVEELIIQCSSRELDMNVKSMWKG